MEEQLPSESGIKPSPVHSKRSLDIETPTVSPTPAVSSTTCFRPMSIIKTDIKEKLSKLSLFHPIMANAIDSKCSDVVYGNTSGTTDSMEAQTFEDRYKFRRASDLPPPLPPHPSKDQVTLPRVVGTTPKKLGSPGSPRVGVKYHWESQDTSFDTITSKEESNYREAHYKDKLLLAETLKTLAVRESTQKTSKKVINKYICLTFILTNLMSIGFSVLGSILVMKSMSQCNPQIYNEPQARFQIPMKEDPDYLTKHVEPQSVVNPVLKLKSDEKSDEKDTEADTHTGLPAADKDTYQIHIKVENKTIDHGQDDFWLAD